MTTEQKPHNAQAILFKRRNAYQLAFCRGSEKGCVKNLTLQSGIGPCPDCVIAENPDETIGDFLARMKKGDA
jgi:hypothetical protein